MRTASEPGVSTRGECHSVLNESDYTHTHIYTQEHGTNMQLCSLAMQPEKTSGLVIEPPETPGDDTIQFKALGLFISILGAEIRPCRPKS